MATTGWILAGSGASVSRSQTSWSNAGNITADDGSEASSGVLIDPDATDYLRGYNFPLSGVIPAGATINGVQMRVQMRAPGDLLDEDAIYLSKNGTTVVGNNKSTGAQWPTSATNVDYGGTSDLWGTTITRTEIVASSFSLFFAGVLFSEFDTAYVDAIWINVDYTAAVDPDYEQTDFRWYNDDGTGLGAEP